MILDSDTIYAMAKQRAEESNYVVVVYILDDNSHVFHQPKRGMLPIDIANRVVSSYSVYPESMIVKR